MIATESSSGARKTLQGVTGLLGLLAGVCTIFALVVTLAEGWQEALQAKWPQATARVQRCSVEEHHGSGGGESAGHKLHSMPH